MEMALAEVIVRVEMETALDIIGIVLMEMDIAPAEVKTAGVMIETETVKTAEVMTEAEAAKAAEAMTETEAVKAAEAMTETEAAKAAEVMTGAEAVKAAVIFTEIAVMAVVSTEVEVEAEAADIIAIGDNIRVLDIRTAVMDMVDILIISAVVMMKMKIQLRNLQRNVLLLVQRRMKR